MSKIVDTKGNLCPKPLIMTKKALNEINAGEPLVILTDNETSFNNLMTYLKDQHAEPDVKRDGNSWEISVHKPNSFDSSVNVEDYCEIENTASNSKNYVIQITSDKMGEGDPDLGKLLLRAFVNTIPDMDNLPTHIILYNSAVKLLEESSDLVPTFKSLEEQGIRIMACGTCIDFYNLKDKIVVGMISNMYTIMETLTAAGSIIKP